MCKHDFNATHNRVLNLPSSLFFVNSCNHVFFIHWVTFIGNISIKLHNQITFPSNICQCSNKNLDCLISQQHFPARNKTSATCYIYSIRRKQIVGLQTIFFFGTELLGRMICMNFVSLFPPQLSSAKELIILIVDLSQSFPGQGIHLSLTFSIISHIFPHSSEVAVLLPSHFNFHNFSQLGIIRNCVLMYYNTEYTFMQIYIVHNKSENKIIWGNYKPMIYMSCTQFCGLNNKISTF